MYASRFLTQRGLSCSHEGFFNFDEPEIIWQRVLGEAEATESGISLRRGAAPKERSADASYMAMPYLDDPRLSDTPVLHIVRHPLDVISSFVLDLGYFGGDKPDDYHDIWENWISKHWNSPNSNAATNAADYYVFWNRQISRKASNCHRIRIEDGIDSKSLEFLGATGWDTAVIDANSFRYRRTQRPIQWNDIDQPQRSDLIKLTKEYGYPVRKMF